MKINAPPNDIEAERAVLSAVLLSAEAFDEVVRTVSAESFYTDAHQCIWRVIADLRGANRICDPVVVAGRLKDKGWLDRIGGTPYLAELVDATPAVAHIGEHAERVRTKSQLRDVIALMHQRIADAASCSDSREFLNDLAREVEGIQGERLNETISIAREMAKAEVDEFFERYRAGGGMVGLPSGLRHVDELLGGLKRKNLYVAAGRPGMGKTGFALGIAMHIASLGFGVPVISMEMPREQVRQRAIAQIGRLDIGLIEKGLMTHSQVDRFTKAAERFGRLPLAVDEAKRHSVSSLRSAVRRSMLKLRRDNPDLNMGLIVVDYIQLMEENADNRTNEVTQIINGCAELAGEFNVPVLALSQLNRNVEQRADKRPEMSDLRDSGAIEQAAFAIMGLYRDDKYRKPGEKMDGIAEVAVIKARQGAREGTCLCDFHGPSTAYSDLPDSIEQPYQRDAA